MRLPWRRRGHDVFPQEWLPIVARSVAQWRYLAPWERDRMIELTWSLIDDVNWEAAKGFALTDEIRVTIAAQAVLLVLGLDDGAYADVGVIIVHPTTMTLTGPRAGPARGIVDDSPLPALGVAHYDGPVIIAWDAALAGARHPERGHNVVYHEFAHKLDMLDGTVDGTPPLENRAQLQRWIEVCTAEYEQLQRGDGDPLLDSYGGVSVAEFFAVVTEVFFDLPVAMEAQKPDLYGVLRDFYRQDPAARVRATIDR